MSRPSYTHLSVKELQGTGYFAGRVDRQCGPITRDLAGIIDLMAWRAPEIGVLAVQSTSTSNMRARLSKCFGDLKAFQSDKVDEQKAKLLAATVVHDLHTFLRCHNRFQVWGWKLYMEGRGSVARLSRYTISLHGNDLIAFDMDSMKSIREREVSF